jgi:hypothetical protein
MNSLGGITPDLKSWSLLLFESDANAISLPPNDITGKWYIIPLKDDAKTLRDIFRVSDLNRRARNAHIAD